MRRIILFVLGFVLMVFLSSCSLFGGGAKVSSLELKTFVSGVMTSVSVTPNYSLRVLDVKYSKIFPEDKVLPTEVNPMSTEGRVGGEFFDRFEEILVLVNGQKEDPIDPDVTIGGVSEKVKVKECLGDVLYISVYKDSKFKGYTFCPEEKIPGFDSAVLFVDDLSKIFLEDVY